MNMEIAISIIGVGYIKILFGIWLYKKLDKSEVMYKIIDKTNLFIEDYILELFVGIPWLENRIRSYRLGEKDIEAMAKKGYNIFDADKGRFVQKLA